MDTENQKEIAEEQMIEQAFQELLNDYLATKHRKRIEIITKAFNFANQAHKGIKRRSGEPYIMHPIAVAKIVCNEIGLGRYPLNGFFQHTSHLIGSHPHCSFGFRLGYRKCGRFYR